MASSNYNRMGFKEEKADVKDTMIEEFTSPLVAELRANGGTVSFPATYRVQCSVK